VPMPAAVTRPDPGAVITADAKSAAFSAGASTWTGWNTDAYGNCYGTATTSASTTIIVNGTWSAWNTVLVTGSTAASQAGTAGYGITVGQWSSWNTAYEETAEQQAAREEAQAEAGRQAAERREELNARYEQERLEREQAKARALELLRSLLTGEQWASYQENGWFEVRGSKGGRWRIRNRGQSGNVDLMPEIGGERDASYCAHPPGMLPDPDAHAAQMLALVTDEEMFVRTAIVHYRRQPASGQEQVHAETGPRRAA
jgi:hypothetical protein